MARRRRRARRRQRRQERRQPDAARFGIRAPGARRLARRQRRRGGAAGQAIGQAFQGQIDDAALRALFNRLNQAGALGGRQFVQDPETGQFTVVDDFGGNQQLLEQLQGLGQQGAAGVQDILNQEAFAPPEALPQFGDFAGDRQRIEDELFGRFNEQFEPVFEKQRADLEANLARRGIPVGSELFNKQIEELETRQNEARSNARSEATQFAGQEQQRLFEGALTGRQQQIQEGLQGRLQPFQELGNLLALQANIPQAQLFAPSQINIPGVDRLGGALGFLQNQTVRRGQDFNLRAALDHGPFLGLGDRLALINAQAAADRGTAAFTSGLGSQGSGGSGSISPGQQIAGSFLGGIGGGIGSSFGSFF